MCFLCSRIQSRIPYRVYLSGLFNLQSLTVSQSFLIFHELDTLLTGCFFKLPPVSCYQAPSFSNHFLTFWKHKMSQTHILPPSVQHQSLLPGFPGSFNGEWTLFGEKACLECLWCARFYSKGLTWIITSECSETQVLFTQLCQTLCNPMDCGLPGSSVHGILQARILEWVAIPFSRESSPTQGSNCMGRRILYRLSHHPI